MLCVFLGYSTSHHGYRCFDPQSERIYIARHVHFHEDSFPYHTISSPNPPTPTSSNPYVSSYPNIPPDLNYSNTPPLPQHQSPSPDPEIAHETPPSLDQQSTIPPSQQHQPSSPQHPTPPPPPPPPPPSPPLPPLIYTYARNTHSRSTIPTPTT
ncbi:protein TRACHEARY ELEMENT DIFFERENTIATION-RELATED 7A-like [Lactuca sativa]|uniref:protein TRACHEARY ELEMENT DIFFERENTIATION-RELATED 7A-like n=1 Tax=Lactuca sativa TaxID=4236 RepID=UPI0022B05F50|nr:protein TRACHEARY ELEMENT DIFFERENTIATION-RELATED 7A-like [Lactuca sativa]